MDAQDTASGQQQRSLSEQARRRGMRLTAPRLRVLGALERLGHATPEDIVAELARVGSEQRPAPSTVYRNLEALADAGLVRHTHLDHGPPSYHLAEHGEHLHLVCSGCGAVAETSAQTPETTALAGNLLARHGFDADMTHMAIHGRCARCRQSQTQTQG